MQAVLDELKLLLRSRYGLLAIPSPEEDRVEGLVRLLADHVGLPLFVWTRMWGLRRDGEPRGVYGTQKAPAAFAHVHSSRFPAIYLFRGLAPELADPELAERLRETAGLFREVTGALVLTGEPLPIPESLRVHTAVVQLPAPSGDDFRALLEQIIRDLRAANHSISINISAEELNRLLANLRGLTLLEAEKVLTRAIVGDYSLSGSDIQIVLEAKREIVERDGLLEYYPVEANLTQVADLAGLKAWLGKRKHVIDNPEAARAHGLSFPKGVLLVGIPGTGKSLCAKAVAMEWSLPLLKMDTATLYNKFLGETERNFKRAMETAERMSPVVLWIDEIEKAFAAGGADQDGGASTRVLGTFLSWLQDRRGDVFVVATANDVSKLPPELLRKGRFDEIFFVDLPDERARQELFWIHLGRRGLDPSQFDLAWLSQASAGFTGADIEQVVVSALYATFAERTSLDTARLVAELQATRPLTQTMPERIEALRAWGQGRTVRAN